LSDAYLGEVAGGKPAGIPFDAFDPLQLPFLRIGNLDEIKKRVGEEEFREWQNQFGVAFPDDVDFRIEYCPCLMSSGRVELR
jgi:hypothetical protein